MADEDIWKESNDAVIAVVEAPPEREERRANKEKTSTKPKTQPPYHVIIWNDEEHSYEDVIVMLMVLFGHSMEAAFKITEEVDLRGKGIAWTCHQELAELKRDQVLAYSDWPEPDVSKGSLRATIEPAPD